MMEFLQSRRVLIGLVVLDLLAIAIAVYLANRPPPEYTGKLPTPTESASAAPNASGATQLTSPVALAASPDGALIRATRGSCDARNATVAQVWVSAAAGAPMKPAQLAELQEVLGIARASDNDITVIGATQSCKVGAWTSTDGGQSWAQGDKPRGAWRLDTNTAATEVFAPDGSSVSSECAPIAISTVDKSNSVATCRDRVMVLAKDGNIKIEVPQAGGAATKSNGDTVLLAPSKACPLTIYTAKPGRQPVPSAKCIRFPGAALGLAVSKRFIFAQVGDALVYSDNGGKAFKAVPGV